MPNPSTTQVVESREQIALADDAGGVNRDRMWALELFWDEVEKSVGQRAQLEANQTSFVRQNLPIAASNASLLCCNYPTPCRMACSVCLIIGGEDDARFHPN